MLSVRRCIGEMDGHESMALYLHTGSNAIQNRICQSVDNNNGHQFHHYAVHLVR